MAGSQLYTRKVMNRSGNILFFPEVASMSELLDGSATLNPYAESTTQEFPLGTKLVKGDRIYRYAYSGTGMAAGVPLQSAATLHADADKDLVPAAISAIGAYTVTLTGTANTVCAANYYKEGYLNINDGTGEGHSYKIKSHTACTGAATFVITLYDPIVIALAATSATQCGLSKNPYDSVIATAAVLTGVPVGIATHAWTTNTYGWIQTGGPCSVVAHAAIARGMAVLVGTTAAKADPNVDNASTLQIIGFALTPGLTDTEEFLVFLTLDR